MFAISNWDLLRTVSIIGYVCNKQLGKFISVVIKVNVCNNQLGQIYNCEYNKLCLQSAIGTYV